MSRLEKLIQKNAAFEGVLWPFKKRLKVLNELYTRFVKLTPWKFEPLVKSFNSFSEYEKWKKRQKNPWYW